MKPSTQLYLGLAFYAVIAVILVILFVASYTGPLP